MPKKRYLQQERSITKDTGHPISSEQRESISKRNKEPNSAYQKMMKERWSDPVFRERIAKSDHNSWKNGNRDRNNPSSSFTLGYWINKGYSKDDAKLHLSNNNRRDLDYFIEKYGENDRTNSL